MDRRLRSGRAGAGMVNGLLRAALQYSLILALALAAAACASVATKPEPPEVTLEAVRILRVAEAKADISLRLKLANPNPFDLPVDSIEFEVTLDGQPAANGRSSRIGRLPAGGEATVDVTGRVDVVAIATALMTIGSRPVDYAVRGSATLSGGGVVPFARKGQIPATRFDRAFGSRP